MINPNIFSIRNLQCAYNSDKVVVNIKSLDIPRGKFVSLMSVSGGGKSTTLESLGLMNKTFIQGSGIDFYPGEEGRGYSYEELWDPKNERQAANIRREHFSFIFQQTNLMPNFSAYENICITQMLQGKSQAEAISHAQTVMNTIGLGGVDETKKAYELSGGEQQRVAFARAITPEFSVIFGDEPTGNLDHENAISLMQKLYDVVSEKNRTAIIVSHDLALMQYFAGMLVVLEKRHDTGELFPENIFLSSSPPGPTRTWEDLNGNPVPDLYSRVKSIMNTPNVA